MSEDDKKIRERLKLKDLDLSKQLQNQMKKQEELLKNYFQEYKKPVKQDPTIVKKNETKHLQIEERANLLKSAFVSVNIFSNFYDGFWNAQLRTVEQRNALSLAKQNILSNIFKCVFGCLLITSITSYRQRKYMKWPSHLFGAITGVGTGIILGIAISTKETFQQFQKLGDDYKFSRHIINDLEKNRMDKK